MREKDKAYYDYLRMKNSLISQLRQEGYQIFEMRRKSRGLYKLAFFFSEIFLIIAMFSLLVITIVTGSMLSGILLTISIALIVILQPLLEWLVSVLSSDKHSKRAGLGAIPEIFEEIKEFGLFRAIGYWFFQTCFDNETDTSYYKAPTMPGHWDD